MLPKQALTFNERRRRADAKKIAQDFDRIERSFLSYTRRLNTKRQAQTIARFEKLIPDLLKAQEEGNEEELDGLLLSTKLPSSKEWYKGIERLVLDSAETGLLRAHLEVLRIKALNEFSLSIIPEADDFEPNFPEEARAFIKKHAYEVGVITEETAIRRIRSALRRSLKDGDNEAEMKAKLKNAVGSWLGDAHAETIARTETGKFYNAGRIARWLDPEADGFVEALQYDAIIDGRTTEVCRHLDGRTIAVTNQAVIARYTPPNHYQCRATWLPISKYEEWEDDFSTEVQPEDGFGMEIELPKLVKDAKEPLVVAKTISAKKAIDSDGNYDFDVVRSLSDDDFRELMKGVSEDTEAKLMLVQERAEAMLFRSKVLEKKPTKKQPQFTFWGIDNGVGAFDLFGKENEFAGDPSISSDIKKFLLAVRGAGLEEVATELEKFEAEFGESLAHGGFIMAMKKAIKDAPEEIVFNGFKDNSAERTKESKKTLTIQEPKGIKYDAQPELRIAVMKAREWLLKHMAPDTRAEHSKDRVKLVFEPKNDRAYAKGVMGTIHFGPARGDEASIVVHETAHVLHTQSASMSDLIHMFFMKRTEFMTIQKTEWQTRTGTEYAYADDFISTYTGRVYGWEKDNLNAYRKHNLANIGRYGQEVFSMGLQYMYEDPVAFYKRDKDHFLLIYAIMEGLY